MSEDKSKSDTFSGTGPVDNPKAQTELDLKKNLEDETINSTQRSLDFLKESEQLGIATAEELHRQRDQLERTDRRLDEINSTLRFCQKHLNRLKSVFGRLKNYFICANERPTLEAESTSDPIDPRNVSGNNLNKNEVSYNPTTKQEYQLNDDKSNADLIIDENLGEISDYVNKLRNMAVDMSSEIDSQNDLIDNIAGKMDKADLTIGEQDKQIVRLLNMDKNVNKNLYDGEDADLTSDKK